MVHRFLCKLLIHISIDASSVAEVEKHITDVLLPIAEVFDLTLDSFGRKITAGSGEGGHLTLAHAWSTALEPAPTTPTDNDGPYGILSGSIQAAVFSSTPNAGTTPVVAPTLALGRLLRLVRIRRPC